MTTSSTAAAILASTATATDTKGNTPVAKNANIKFLATNWGFEGSVDEYCEKVKKDGYDGIEIWWPLKKEDQDGVFAAVKKNSLDIAFLFGAPQSDFKEHFKLFKEAVTAAATNTSQKPLYVNLHSGRDYFSFEENKQLIDFTIGLSKSSGVKLAHETHRSRILYSAPAARQYFEKIPELRITFDVSHWCNVSESLLADQQSTIDVALERVDAIHARIGHPEGPQVNDPRAPEWDHAVKAHLAWWDKIVELKKQKNDLITFLSEFGPVDYMPAIPYTRRPVADQWGINVYMMQMLKARYGL